MPQIRGSMSTLHTEKDTHYCTMFTSDEVKRQKVLNFPLAVIASMFIPSVLATLDVLATQMGDEDIL